MEKRWNELKEGRKVRGSPDVLQLPSIKVGNALVPRLILGHLPFVGESYQGAEKNKQYRERFSHPRNIVKILTRAISDYGVTAIAAMPAVENSPSAILQAAIRESVNVVGVDVALIPCFMIPLRIDGQPVNDYRRWMTYYDVERKMAGVDLLRRYVDDPVLQCREGWREKFPNALARLQPYSGKDLEKLEIDYGRLRRDLQSLEGFRVLLAEPGSEADFLVMTGRLDLLEDFVNALRDCLNCPIILATHHAGSVLPMLDAVEANVDGYLTPVNMMGVMMFPTQERAVKAIRGARRPVIAIKTMAGGRIRPKEAFEYVYRVQKIGSCMVGVASERELDEDFSIARRILAEG